MKDQFFKLMLVTDKKNIPVDRYMVFIEKCIKAGVTAIQLEEKNLSFNEKLEFGNLLQYVLKPFSASLIINDNIEVAFELDADGIHLSKLGGGVLRARHILGSSKIIGVTVNSLEELRHANTLPINYVNISSIFPTMNKKEGTKVWGCEELLIATQISNVPVVAMGGINESNIFQVIRAGANGVAATKAFHDTLDYESTVRKLYNLIKMGLYV